MPDIFWGDLHNPPIKNQMVHPLVFTERGSHDQLMQKAYYWLFSTIIFTRGHVDIM